MLNAPLSNFCLDICFTLFKCMSAKLNLSLAKLLHGVKAIHPHLLTGNETSGNTMLRFNLIPMETVASCDGVGGETCGLHISHSNTKQFTAYLSHIGLMGK